MAKSQEQKLVDTISSSLSSMDFNAEEFCRLMILSNQMNHKRFFNLIVSYINYLAAYDQYSHYPNGIISESIISGKIHSTLKQMKISS